jgi:hypothetical protein
METRITEEVKIYSLHLNPMPANFEKTNLVAIAPTKEELMVWYENLKVDGYQEDNWHKSFQKGSKLEWYNPIDWSDYCGIREHWTTLETIKSVIRSAEHSFGFEEVPELINCPELI